MIKKLFLIILTIGYCITYADFNQNQYNQAQCTVVWQGNNSDQFSVSGSNIFSGQTISYSNTFPSFVVSSSSTSNQPILQKAQDTQLVYYLVSVDGQKEVVSKEIFDTDLKRVTDDYVSSAQSYFGADMHVLAPAINQAILQGTINTPETHNQLIHQAITHIVMTGQTQLGVVCSFLNHPWVANKDLSDASFDDKIMINYVIFRLAYCNNSTTIELAQGCLRAFDDMQQSKTDNERAVHQETCRSCYLSLLSNPSIQQKNIALHENSMQSDLVNLYYASGKLIDGMHDQIDPHVGMQSGGCHEKYLNRLVEREAVVLKTLQNDPIYTELTDVDFSLSAEVAGYLMAHNINYAAFHNQNCIYFQHLLTNQIVGLLEKNIEIADHSNNHMISQYIQYTCHLAVSAQQLNQNYEIMQAVTLADMSEFFTVIADAVLDCTRDIVVGVGLGVGRSLHSWVVLALNLTIDPLKTMQEGVEILKTAAYLCGQVALAAADYLPLAQLPNIQDFPKNLPFVEDTSQLPQLPDFYENMHQKYQSIKTGSLQAIDSVMPIIKSILQRPAQENIADITQCIVDGVVIDGIGKSLSYTAHFAKSYISGAVATMTESIAPHLMDEKINFAITSTGQVVACMEKTGELIADGMLSAAAGMIDGAIHAAKYIAQGKILSDKVQQVTNADKDKITKLKTMFEKYYRGDILLPGLAKIEGVKQVDAYRAITNNFQDISKLTEADIMYLNMCNGLYPYSVEINELVKKSMLYVTDLEGNVTHIKEFDIFHSFLGEMRANATSYAKKGGHMLFSESKVATHMVEEIIPFNNGYFDLAVKHIGDTAGMTTLKTQFPLGSTPMENAQIMIDLIKNITSPIDIIVNNKGTKIIDLTHQSGQKFAIYIEEGIANFYPISPNVPARIR